MLFLNVLTGGTQSNSGTWLITLAMVAVLVAVFFFSSRSQKKQDRQAAEMRSSIVPGDEVTTIGGIIGRVVKVTEETVVIETGRDRTKLHMLKSAIRSVDVHAEDTIETAEKTAKKAEKEEKAAKPEKKSKKGAKPEALEPEAPAEDTPAEEAEQAE